MTTRPKTSRKTSQAANTPLARFRYETPTGKRILGTLEEIQGRAEVSCLTRDQKTGHIGIHHGGYTEIFWDGQMTVEQNGQRIWLDEDGEEWPENELVEVPIDK